MSASSSSVAPATNKGSPLTTLAGGAGGSDNDETQATSECEISVDVVPHLGHVFVDRPHGQEQMLVHRTTLERRRLPPGDWALEYDDLGFAIVVSQCDGSDTVMVVEDLSLRTLCKDATGALYVHTFPRGAEQGTSFSLSDRMSRHEALECNMRVGSTSARLQVIIYFMRWPRQSFHYYWDSASLYSAMSLNTYQNFPSKWAWTSWKQSWLKFFKELGCEEYAVIGSLRTGANNNEHDSPHACLPTISLSTFATVGLLTRWCSASQKAGGLGDNARRAAAADMLASILRSASSREWSLALYFDDGWMPKWPLSEETAPDITLQVGVDGVVDLRPWSALATSTSQTSVSAKWLRDVLHKPLPVDGREHLSTLLCGSCSFRLPAQFRQIAFAAAKRIDLSLHFSLKRGALGNDCFKVKTTDMWAVLGDPERLGHELLKHVAASVRHSVGFVNFSRCTDKANVGGRQLQAGITVFPDGKTSITCPQAAYFGH